MKIKGPERILPALFSAASAGVMLHGPTFFGRGLADYSAKETHVHERPFLLQLPHGRRAGGVRLPQGAHSHRAPHEDLGRHPRV